MAKATETKVEEKDAPELKTVVETPAEGEGPQSSADVKFVTEKEYEPLFKPKTAPLFPFTVVIGVDRKDYVYEVNGYDEADAIRRVVDINQAFVSIIGRLRRSAKKLDAKPLNVEKLTVAQVEALAGLEDDEKLALMEKAIQPETKAA